MKSQRLRTLSWLIAAALMWACAISAPATQPPSLPGQDLGTIIAGTAVAAQTQTAARITPSPTSTPTRTPSLTPTPATPTPTFFFSINTKTPTPLPTVVFETSAAGGGSGGGGTPGAGGDRGQGGMTGLEWSCGIVERTYGIVEPKEEFTLYVTFRNTGTKPWGNNWVDLVYTGGYRHIGTKIVDMPVTISPGNTVTFGVDFEAPKSPGNRNSFFVLKVGKNEFCGVKLMFEVIDK